MLGCDQPKLGEFFHEKNIAILSKHATASGLSEIKRDVVGFSKTMALLTIVCAFLIYVVSNYYPQFGLLKGSVWSLVRSSLETLLMAIVIFLVLRCTARHR